MVKAKKNLGHKVCFYFTGSHNIAQGMTDGALISVDVHAVDKWSMLRHIRYIVYVRIYSLLVGTCMYVLGGQKVIFVLCMFTS